MKYRDRLRPEVLRTYAQALNARARSIGISGRIDGETLRSVMAQAGGACMWCGRSVVDAEFEIDHVLSLAAGGAHHADNLALTCPDCNRLKGSKHPARFAVETLNRGVAMSAFLQQMLDTYGDGTPPPIQRGLFDAPTEDDDAPDEIPPYSW
jgi:5-methylcytosine-specific restriction endonuclease McrA